MSEQQAPFENDWRRKMDAYRPEATDGDWAEMQELLVTSRKGRSSRFRRWWVWLLPLLGLGGILLFRAGTTTPVAGAGGPPMARVEGARDPAEQNPSDDLKNLPEPAAEPEKQEAIAVAVPQPQLRTDTTPSLFPSVGPLSLPHTPAVVLPPDRVDQVTTSIPMASLHPPRSSAPSLADQLEMAGKTLIVVPGPGPPPPRKLDNGLYPPFRN